MSPTPFPYLRPHVVSLSNHNKLPSVASCSLRQAQGERLGGNTAKPPKFPFMLSLSKYRKLLNTRVGDKKGKSKRD